MKITPPIDESVTTPYVDEQIRNFILENLEGLYRVQITRKRDRRKFEPVASIDLAERSAQTAVGQEPQEDPDMIVEETLRCAAHYCAHKRPDDEEGPLAFRFMCYVASAGSSRAKRPSIEWVFDPDTHDQQITVSEGVELMGDPMERVVEKQAQLINALFVRLDRKDEALMKMFRMSSMQFEPLMQQMQFMGYGWLQGMQMQQNALQAISEAQAGVNEEKTRGERLKIAGNVLQGALPVLAEKLGIYAVLQAGQKLNMSKDEIMGMLQKKQGAAPVSAPTPAVAAAPDGAGGSSFGLVANPDENPLSELGRTFAAFIRPSQWRLITSTLDEAEFETFRALTESADDQHVIAAFDQFMSIDTDKLMALHAALDTEQKNTLTQFGEAIGKVKEVQASQ